MQEDIKLSKSLSISKTQKLEIRDKMKDFCKNEIKTTIDEKKFIEKPSWFWIGIFGFVAFIVASLISINIALIVYIYKEQQQFYIQKVEDLKSFYQEKIIDYKTYDKECMIKK